MTEAAYEIDGRPVAAAAFYRVACNPNRSVAVQACAGAGKTWMLVSRILRALVQGARGTPALQADEILAITFTRKAAAEMRERLQRELRDAAFQTPTQLQAWLLARGFDEETAGFGISEAALQLQKLYQDLLQGGRGVQIRTFHGWFAALLRAAPLALLGELGFPSRYELLEDDAEALELLWPRLFARLRRDTVALADFEAGVRAHGRSATLRALQVAVGRRLEFRLADAAGVLQTSVWPFGQAYPHLAAYAEPHDALLLPAARERWLARARVLGQQTLKTPQQAAQAILAAFEQDDGARRLALLARGFLVRDGDRLTQHLRKFDVAVDAADELLPLLQARAQHEAWMHQQRMTRLSRLALDEFAQLKRERGWIDMTDVEWAARRLLGDPELGGWLQQRLDARVRHLLIDEFQDTSPLQWQTLHAWLASYAGSGGGAAAPRLFIVGDPKQSIYRFRRAEPQVFRAALDFMTQGLEGHVLRCDHTRRNAHAVVHAVNATLLEAQDAGEFSGYQAHTTASALQGAVLALPVIERERAAVVPHDPGEATDISNDAPDSSWRNSLTTPRVLPEDSWRSIECRQAARWIAAQLAQNTALQPQHFMVLSRKRANLALMHEALRAEHVPAHQPEQSDLGAAPEVRDLTALLDVLVSPQHNLALAQALKSPLFGAGDTDLVALADATAPGTPWLDTLLAQPFDALPLTRAASCLPRWRDWVRQLPPHDALQAIYDDGDVMARFLAAAPRTQRAQVQAHLQALLGAALDYRGGRFITPYAWVRALRSGRIRAPALAAPQAVRLLTVHGAKGLEADHVLLLDLDVAAPRADTMSALIDWPAASAAPQRFSFLLRERAPPVCNHAALEHEQRERAREDLNALYVAATRARERLVLSAIRPARRAAANGGALPEGAPDAADADRGPRNWWQRLSPHAQPLPAPGAAPADAEGGAALAGDRISLLELPLRQVQKASSATENVAIGVKDVAQARVARVGEALHRLLEWAPDAGAAGWSPAQQQAVARDFDLDTNGVVQAHAMACAIRFGAAAWAWDAAQLAWSGSEVALTWRGQRLRLDRLVQRRDTGAWWVLDFKSAAHPEHDAALRAQLWTYRQAVAALCAAPGAADESRPSVVAAFVTAQGALRVIEAEEPA